MKRFSVLYSLIFTIVFGGIYYYFLYPSLNIHNPEFWFFILILVFVFSLLKAILSFDIKQI